ncbi:MAG: hypothetical protein JOZ00_14835 [Mycobacterium sp.]|nr:hypothetical protein [Mycobacterium sp.]
MTFTAARRARKAFRVEFNESAHTPKKTKDQTVSPLQSWIRQAPTNLDVMTPIKTRAFDALNVVLNTTRRPADAGPRLMTRGAERC